MKAPSILLLIPLLNLCISAKTRHQTILHPQESVRNQKYYNLLPRVGKNPDISFIRSRHPENMSLEDSFLAMLAAATDAQTFIETGTYKGDTTAKAAEHFKYIHSIELGADLYEQAKNRFKGQSRVCVYHGDSAEVLPTVLKKAKGKTLIFLDAHFSLFDTAQGSKNTPIITELTVIKKSGIDDATIIIDDMRMFYTPQIEVKNTFIDGYPTVHDLVAKILEINPEYQLAVVYDTLIAFVASEGITVSPAVKAATISRLYEQDNFAIEHVLEAELCIAQSTDKEKQTFIDLIEKCYEPWSAAPGFSSHYDLWYGLILMEQEEYTKALAYFQDAQLRGLYHWRLEWYMLMAQANCFFDKR